MVDVMDFAARCEHGVPLYAHGRDCVEYFGIDGEGVHCSWSKTYRPALEAWRYARQVVGQQVPAGE